MTDKVNPSVNRPAEAFKTAGAIGYGGHANGPDKGFVVDGANPTEVSSQDAGINEGALNTFSVEQLVPQFEESAQIFESSPAPTDMAFNDTGGEVFTVDNDRNAVVRFTLSSNYDIGTIGSTQSFDVSGQTTDIVGIEFNNNGTKMFVVANDTNSVYEYNLSTAFDLSTASVASGEAYDYSGQTAGAQTMAFDDTGSRMYIGATSGTIYEYSLSTNFDVSTASFTDSFTDSSNSNTVNALAFDDVGDKAFAVSNAGIVFEYSLSSPYDISTATSENTFNTTEYDNDPQGIEFDETEDAFILVGLQNKQFTKWSLPASYDLYLDTLDVTVDPGEAFIFGSWLAIDTTTTVTLPSSVSNETVYVGWNKNGSDDVIVGLDTAFDEASGDTDIKIPLYEFDTNSTQVIAQDDRRRIGYTIDVDGKVYFGDNAETSIGYNGTELEITGAVLHNAGGDRALHTVDNTFVAHSVESYRNSGSDHGMFQTFSARGVEDQPKQIQANDKLLTLRARGHDGQDFVIAGDLVFTADETFTGGSKGTNMIVSLAPPGSVTREDAFKVGADGLTEVLNGGFRLHNVTSDLSSQPAGTMWYRSDLD